MNASVASDGQWPVAAAENAARRETGLTVEAKPHGRRRPLRTLLGLVDDGVLLLLVVLLFPLVILLVGTPVALFVRLLIEIAHRL